MIISSKIVTALAWIAIVLNWLAPSLFASFGETVGTVLNWSGLILIIAHCIETAVFLPKAKKLGGNMANHIVQLLLFGYVYNMEMDKLLSAKS